LMSLVAMLTGVWISEYLAADIRSGGLSKYLLRPAPIMAGQIGNNLGEKVIKLFLLGPFVLAAAIVFRHDIDLPGDPRVWALFAVALVLAGMLSFLIDYLIGSLAFWLQAVNGLLALEGLIAGLLAGRLVPLALFPPELAPLLAAQPWRYTLSFPIEIVTGALTPAAIVYGLLVQSAYVVAAALGVRVVWRSGLRSYAATGG
jgi:viologen exporter family transport system permease protein